MSSSLKRNPVTSWMVGVSVVAACATSLVLATPSPAQAAYATFFNAGLSSNTWKWSGHVWSIGGQVTDVDYLHNRVMLMNSSSSAIYGGYAWVFSDWSNQYVSIACGHTAGYTLTVKCERKY